MNKKLLGVRIDYLDKKKLFSKLDKFLKSEKFNMITPVNPEMLIQARNNKHFKKVLNKSELNTCEAAGTYFALKLKGRKIKKYPGSSMIFDILEYAQDAGKRVFFLGTKPEINLEARKEIKKKYPEINIEGYSPPHIKKKIDRFPKKIEDKIFSMLKKQKTDILYLFFGAPFQESWLNRNRKKLKNIGVKVGVSGGGTADFLSGRTKRAPDFYKNNHLEWLYRLITESGRFKRFITRIPLFSLLILRETLFNQ